MKIYFAAHATTIDNEAKISSGWKDVELSKLGIEQSKELGERFTPLEVLGRKNLRNFFLLCNNKIISKNHSLFGISYLPYKDRPLTGFKEIKIDLICCSDLKRAVDTVKIAFGDKIPVIIDRRLRELNYGDFNGKPSEVVEGMKKKHIKEPYPNGESYEQTMTRIHEFYKELKEKYSDKIVLVVGHRATQYGLDTLVGNKTLEECLNIPFKWQPYWEYNL